MASLTAHLVESGGHGRLGFHASCPVCCQERLFGSLSSDAVVSRRAQAALASGVLALSAVGPPVAAAQEPDQQLEGGSGAGQAPGGGETGSGAVDAPGSGTGVAPPTEVVPPAAPDLDPLAPPDAGGESVLREVVPVETAPIEAPSPPSAPGAGPGPETLPDNPEPEPSPPTPAPDPSVDEPDPVPPPSELEGAEPSESPTPTPPAKDATDNNQTQGTAEPKPRENPPPQPSAAVPPPPSVPAEPTAPAPAAEPQPMLTPSSAASTKPGRLLVVQPGDSLWSIAKRLLGPGASPAEIARKVSRLWELNAARIGTGRPDLILVGTKLELR
jgi:hypothetical protein